MLFTLATASAILSGLVAAAPFGLPNGFPFSSVQDPGLQQVSVDAGGVIGNGPLPENTLTPEVITTLQVLAANEIFEVAYFSSLLANVTDGVDGYTELPLDKDYVVRILTAIVAQEQLHATGVNYLIGTNNGTVITPCNYQFPVADFNAAIALADVFTELVLGTLQSVQTQFASSNEGSRSLVGLFGSIVGQEAEQVGGYRMIEGRIPSSAPFLTGSTGKLAFNAVAQTFIVPGSCDDVVATIGIPIIDTLAVVGNVAAANQTVTFETSCTDTTEGVNYIAYLSGQNLPVVVPISNVTTQGGMTTFQAALPFDAGFAKGLTIAALVNTNQGLDTADAVTAAAFAGPGLIQVE